MGKVLRVCVKNTFFEKQELFGITGDMDFSKVVPTNVRTSLYQELEKLKVWENFVVFCFK